MKLLVSYDRLLVVILLNFIKMSLLGMTRKWSMDYNEEEQKQISKYNDAGLSISRLHENWLRCNRFIREGNFRRWKYELDMIWLELYPDMLRHKDKIKLTEENDKLMGVISKSGDRNNLFFNLMKRHEFLRSLQDKSGKAGVYGDADDQELE